MIFLKLYVYAVKCINLYLNAMKSLVYMHSSFVSYPVQNIFHFPVTCNVNI